MIQLDFNRTEQEKLNRLQTVFSRNRRLMRLYSAYLSDSPNLVTKDMTDSLGRGCGVSVSYAYASCLSVFFGLDPEHSAEDRRFEREYLIPSISMLETKKYTDNPYYRTVRIPKSEQCGSWELRQETYPACRAFVCGGPVLHGDFREYPQIGFFNEPFCFPAVLENQNEWMTLTPVDLDTSEDAIATAHGKVITFGLGLGYFAFMASEKENVHSVTVIEKSPDVIRLFRTFILPQLPHAEKIRIICADAFEYAETSMPQEHFDVAFADTWRDVSDGLGMYLRMKRLERYNPETKFVYWIEGMILSHLRGLVFDSLTEQGESSALFFPETSRVLKTCRELEAFLTDDALRSAAPLMQSIPGYF